MNEPFFSEDLIDALDQVKHQLEICCAGVSAQVEEFVHSFKKGDLAFLVYAMEAMAAGIKANFTEYDSYVYDLLTLSVEFMVIKGPDVEADDDES